MKVQVFLSVKLPLERHMKSSFLKNLQIFKSGLIDNKNSVICFDSKLTRFFFISLWKQGFLKGVKKISLRSRKKDSISRFLLVFLNHYGSRCSVNTLQMISTAQHPIYVNWRNLTTFYKRKEILFISTPLGILTQEQCLRFKVGGKILCSVN